MMYLWASQSFGLYLRSAAFVRDAEPPFELVLFVDARWARSSCWPPVAALVRRPRLFLAMLMVRPTYGSVYTQDSGVWRSDEWQKALIQVAGPVYEQKVPSASGT